MCVNDSDVIYYLGPLSHKNLCVFPLSPFVPGACLLFSLLLCHAKDLVQLSGSQHSGQRKQQGRWVLARVGRKDEGLRFLFCLHKVGGKKPKGKGSQDMPEGADSLVHPRRNGWLIGQRMGGLIFCSLDKGGNMEDSKVWKRVFLQQE